MNRNNTKLPADGWTETLVREPDAGPLRTVRDIIVSDYQCVESSIMPLAEMETLEDIFEFLNTTRVMGRELLEFDIISLHAKALHESFLAVAEYRASQFARIDEEIIQRSDLPMALVRLSDPLPQFRPK